jgi:hypothetical protein
MLKQLTVAGSLAVFIALGSLTPLSAAQNPPAQRVGEPTSQSDTQDTTKMHEEKMGGKMDGGKMQGGKMQGGKMHGEKMQCGKMHGEKMAQMKAGEMNDQMGATHEQKMHGRGMMMKK